MNKIELLAPVASKEGLRAVINAGADAVYIGGTKFGARAYADNLDKEDMISAIEYAHMYNVKVYMTVNILLKELEVVEELYDYILPYYKAGLDGVIVQDMGVLAYLDKSFPMLEKHASTQMTIVSSECKDMMDRYHVTRVVPARELSIDEIKEIKTGTGLEVEVFVHGALCYCYSGQCLMSSLIGDRSGNRGRCAQPCRKQYGLYRKDDCIGNGDYILSPKDLCGLYCLHDLILAGVDSLKIEGRMKKPEYAACIVSIYRKYIDMYYHLGHDIYTEYIYKNKEEFRTDIMYMQDVYNRGGYTKGYYTKHNGADMMSIDIPSHFGTYVGKVNKVYVKSVEILLDEAINAHDVLEIRDDRVTSDRARYEFTTKSEYKKGDICTTNIYKGLRLHKGQKVYRTKNNQLVDTMNELYIACDKKIDIDMKVCICKDTPIRVELSMYDDTFSYEFDIPELSQNRPITEENVKKQFSKLSNTCFILNELEVKLDHGLFMPLGRLNEIRRDALNYMVKEYVTKFYREDVGSPYTDEVLEEKLNFLSIGKENIAILVPNIDMLRTLVSYIERYRDKEIGVQSIKRVYIELDGLCKVPLLDIDFMLDKITDLEIKAYIALPRMIRKKHKNYVLEKYDAIFESEDVAGFLVRNVEGLHLVREYEKDIILDSNMYIMNSFAMQVWKNYGVTSYTYSLELTGEELEVLSEKALPEMKIESVVYGKPVVMVSAGCVKKTKGICDATLETLVLKDEYKNSYGVRTVCEYCYNLIYNADKIDIIDDVQKIAHSYRIELLDESDREIEELLDRILSVGDSCKQITSKGHFYKKVL